ncbi:MtrAB system histidine kinase MtrB [Cumulibacter manganitolerans]|uniref:MtrAB system histidine kinase MtrB n=1 Tax=Cumulibacter manganitolerans TaxID=1884992 RepID=UPI00129532AC|nr:MtrAB system histidine kinase MtrB [Cumulibacter manganitolerans]
MRYLDLTRERVAVIGAQIATRWRRSLQLRVVALTLALTAAVVAIIGYVLMTQIRDQLLNAKQRVAIEQASTGVRHLEQQIAIVGGGSGQSSLSETVRTSVSSLQARSTAAGQFYVLAVERNDAGAIVRTIASQSAPSSAELPRDLQKQVRKGNLVHEYATVQIDRVTTQVLMVGSPVPGDYAGYELYYVYPLQNEIDVMTFVERTVIAAALAFMVLIPGVGLLVSRLVVLPVREASDIAERLADGNLQERMDVRGEDDLARLATSFNKMAGSLSSQIARLELLSQVQQRFSSDVSHELRTPLTTVRMAAEMLYDYREDFPDIAARSAELLHAELDRFEALLKDLLEISRYDAGGLALDAEVEDVPALITRVVDAYRSLAADQGCELVVRIADDVGTAEISPRRIERVLRNLIANALEHGMHEPVEIDAAADDEVLAISVRDHGIGIDETAAEHLFDRFWRADPSRVRKLGGTGLGMAISLEDVRLHGGWLQVWGSPGRGTCFRVTVPLRAGETVTHSTLPLVPDGQTGGAAGGVPSVVPIMPALEAGPVPTPARPREGSE